MMFDNRWVIEAFSLTSTVMVPHDGTHLLLLVEHEPLAKDLCFPVSFDAQFLTWQIRDRIFVDGCSAILLLIKPDVDSFPLYWYA